MRSMSRIVVLAGLVAVLSIVSGCSSGSTTASPNSVTTVGASSTSSVLVGPQAFAQRVATPGVVTINVHVPNRGNIGGTDLEIPFDQIEASTALPADLATPLAVYCRSGNMSAPAVKDLAAKGYTDIVELEGGYDAWVQAGLPFESAAP